MVLKQPQLVSLLPQQLAPLCTLLTSLLGLCDSIVCFERRCTLCRCCQRSCPCGSCCRPTRRAMAWLLSQMRCPLKCAPCQTWRELEVGRKRLFHAEFQGQQGAAGALVLYCCG